MTSMVWEQALEDGAVKQALHAPATGACTTSGPECVTTASTMQVYTELYRVEACTRKSASQASTACYCHQCVRDDCSEVCMPSSCCISVPVWLGSHGPCADSTTQVCSQT